MLCVIGNTEIERALLDLGAGVNLLPYSMYQQLGSGELKPTSTVLQLANRSIKKPRGIVKDVIIKVDKIYYPVDFIVLDTELVPYLEMLSSLGVLSSPQPTHASIVGLEL